MTNGPPSALLFTPPKKTTKALLQTIKEQKTREKSLNTLIKVFGLFSSLDRWVQQKRKQKTKQETHSRYLKKTVIFFGIIFIFI